MKLIINKILPPMLIAFGCLLYSTDSFGVDREFVISIPAEKIIHHLQNGKRIMSYSIELPNSEVYGLMNIQSDWIIRVENYHPDRLYAGAGHGVSYITTDDIKKGAFNNFLLVKLSESIDLEIKAHFEIDVPEELDKPLKVVIEKKDMVITPMTDSPILSKATSK